MKILHVSCSPRGQSSESYGLSRKIIGLLLKREPRAVLVTRVIGGGADWQALRTSALDRQRTHFSDRSMAAGVAQVYREIAD